MMKKCILFSLVFFTLIAQADPLPSIAIVDFTSAKSTRLVKTLPDLISERLVNSDMFDVLERAKIDNAVTEMGFAQSGLVNQDTAVQIGQFIGAKYLLTGKLLDFGSKKTNFRGYGTSVSTATSRLLVSAEIIETATGRKVFSRKASSESKSSAMGGLSVWDDTAGTQLAEDVADKLVTAMENSRRLQKITQTNKKPEDAEITITSTPDNADIEIDGVFYGNTGNAFNVPSGLHTIRVTLPGNEIWEKKVMVKHGMNFNVTLTEKIDQNINLKIKEDITNH